MSALAEDTLAALLKKLGKRKRQPWQKAPKTCMWVDALRDEAWDKIHPVMVAALDEMKEHGAKSPLVMLQELAFRAALKPGAAPHVHTAALWLTDTRLRVEAFRQHPHNDSLRGPLKKRGVFKSPRDS